MNAKLRQAVTTPMRTILAVRACFDYCETLEDVQTVVKKIPPKFGTFEISAVSEDAGYFLIQNFFEKYGEMHVQQEMYKFYKVKEEYCYDYGRKA